MGILGNFLNPHLSPKLGLGTKASIWTAWDGVPYLPGWKPFCGRCPLPEDSRLPLLPLMIFPLLPMLASFEVFSVPVSVRSMAISLRLRAAWILDWKGKAYRLKREQKTLAYLES